MYNYKSSYKIKGLNVYGEPNFSILHKLDKFININKDTSILIVNAKDGIYTLPFAKKSKYITCYEENEDLLYGGIIDNFYSVGLVNRLKCNKLDSNVIIHNSNYYEEEHQEKYDLVLSIRTIQDKVNDIYKIKEKFYKLLNSVKDNGYLYLNYYLYEDGYLIENKFGYFKNAIYSNINKLNFDIDSLWDNDLYSEDDFER